MQKNFDLPPKKTTSYGRMRSVGAEFEFSGLALSDAARVVQGRFGGRIDDAGGYIITVRDARFGDFVVELDSSLFQKRNYIEALRSIGIESIAGLERALLLVVSTVVPFEISTPPIPMDELTELELLREALRRKGAQGTGAAAQYAFGLHLNIETPALDHSSIASVLKAFVLLYPHLEQRVAINITRRLMPHVQRFDPEYCRLIMRPGYPDSMDEFLVDYLQYNPTRNRALDLLPLLSSIHGRSIIPANVKVKPRPAFHYRMPNSHIDREDWTIADEWNTWVQVERLAADHHKLGEMSEEYLAADRGETSLPWEQAVTHYLTI